MTPLRDLLEAIAVRGWTGVGEALLSGVVIALAAVALVKIGMPMFLAGRSNLTFEDRQRLKREIVFELRRTLTPTSAVEMAQHLKLDVHDAAGLLQQLERDELLESYTTSERLTFWRVKGLVAPNPQAVADALRRNVRAITLS